MDIHSLKVGLSLHQNVLFLPQSSNFYVDPTSIG